MIRLSDTAAYMAPLLFFSIVLFFGCAETSDTPVIPPADPEPVSSAVSASVSEREQEMFNLLRAAFQDPLLEKDFNTLRTLANSPEYLTYLKEYEEHEENFNTLTEFLNTTAPDADTQFRPLFEEHLQMEPNDQEIAIFYQILVLFESFEITNYIGRFVQPLEERFGVLYADPIVSAVLRRDKRKFLVFEDAYQALAAQNSAATKNTLKTLFRKHGEDEGLLWFAVQEPRDFGLLLNTFKHPLTTSNFRSWVNAKPIVPIQ